MLADGSGENVVIARYNNRKLAEVSFMKWVEGIGSEQTIVEPLGGAIFKLMLGASEVQVSATQKSGVYKVDSSGTATLTTATDGTLKIIGLDKGADYKLIELSNGGEGLLPPGEEPVAEFSVTEAKYTLGTVFKSAPADYDTSTVDVFDILNERE